ncbi:MAG: LeuA family protein [Sulfurifustis sp.]
MEKHLLRHINVFDTTLRDGEQAPSYSLGIDQKLEVAAALEHIGVNTIETGFPASSPTDFEATRQICRTIKRATLCGFARATKEDIEACAAAMAEASDAQVQIASVGSDIHIRYKRGVTRQQVIDEAVAAIDHAHRVGFKQVSLALEDATRGDLRFMKQLIGEGLERGITAIAIPDTVGCCLPAEFYALIKELREFVGEDIRISVHCHNDMGLAVANSIAGIEAGGDEVQLTLLGIGERAGNTSMEEFIAVLNNKAERLNCVHDIIHHRLYDACNRLAGCLGLDIPLHKPIVGRNAFATEAGMHQQGVLKHRFTYEFMRAEDYGAQPRTVIGRHSGRNILRHRLSRAGIKDVDARALDALYSTIMGEERVERYNDPQLLAEKYREVLAAGGPVIERLAAVGRA